MIVRCAPLYEGDRRKVCGATFDDATRLTFCPHNPLGGGEAPLAGDEAWLRHNHPELFTHTHTPAPVAGEPHPLDVALLELAHRRARWNNGDENVTNLLAAVDAVLEQATIRWTVPPRNVATSAGARLPEVPSD